MATILQDLARILTAYKVSCKMCQILAGLNYKFLARAKLMYGHAFYNIYYKNIAIANLYYNT